MAITRNRKRASSVSPPAESTPPSPKKMCASPYYSIFGYESSTDCSNDGDSSEGEGDDSDYVNVSRDDTVEGGEYMHILYDIIG